MWFCPSLDCQVLNIPCEVSNIPCTVPNNHCKHALKSPKNPLQSSKYPLLKSQKPGKNPTNSTEEQFVPERWGCPTTPRRAASSSGTSSSTSVECECISQVGTTCSMFYKRHHIRDIHSVFFIRDSLKRSLECLLYFSGICLGLSLKVSLSKT